MDKELECLNLNNETYLIEENDIKIINGVIPDGYSTDIKKMIYNFMESLGGFLTFREDEKKNFLFSMIMSNMDYYDGENGKYASIDIYDWNMILLYVSFVKYQNYDIEPENYLFEGYFGSVNKEEYEDFKNNKHKTFEFKIK